jgi:hypothetical protein
MAPDDHRMDTIIAVAEESTNAAAVGHEIPGHLSARVPRLATCTKMRQNLNISDNSNARSAQGGTL